MLLGIRGWVAQRKTPLEHKLPNGRGQMQRMDWWNYVKKVLMRVCKWLKKAEAGC